VTGGWCELFFQQTSYVGENNHAFSFNSFAEQEFIIPSIYVTDCHVVTNAFLFFGGWQKLAMSVRWSMAQLVGVTKNLANATPV